jgi:hypothetical protein
LRMRIVLWSSTNCVGLAPGNAFGTKNGTQNTNSGGFLLPATSKTWRVIANKYQAFILVGGSTTARDFCCFGVPWLPSFLASGTVYEAIWLLSNTANDTDTSFRGSFRTQIGGRDQTNGCGNYTTILNGSMVENANNVGNSSIGLLNLVSMTQTTRISNTGTGYRWHDSSAFITDPLIIWGATAITDEGMARGQLWDAFIACDSYTIDTTLTSLDSHNWWNMTSSNTGNSDILRGSLFVVAP